MVHLIFQFNAAILGQDGPRHDGLAWAIPSGFQLLCYLPTDSRRFIYGRASTCTVAYSLEEPEQRDRFQVVAVETSENGGRAESCKGIRTPPQSTGSSPTRSPQTPLWACCVVAGRLDALAQMHAMHHLPRELNTLPGGGGLEEGEGAQKGPGSEGQAAVAPYLAARCSRPLR